ncbi:hypothetical protein B0T16DRAFT_408152 [Cercophora newfieldiana]|uniref:Uncharacterized protein n=1 Tax=Cercophora newfieldiana TaxID=92897 RepID=A0AA39Y9G7_9PEZI|nr:hypothetical protein B0T16DRAFT_408152 [Cercophora newfieldiana]
MPSKISQPLPANQPSLPEVAELLFGRRPSSGDDLKAFFKYYEQQWAEFSAENGTTGALPSFDDFTNVVGQIKGGASREYILSKLAEKHQGKGYPAERLVSLAARTLTMVDTDAKGTDGPAWTSGSLQTFLAGRFSEVPTLESESIKFPNSFDAAIVETMGGIIVEFTDNLAYHLRLVRNGGAVLVFHHVSFLEFLAAGSGDSLLPSDLVKETLQSLSLLFPKNEFSSFLGISSAKSKWLKAGISTWESKPSTGGARVDSHVFQCASLPMYGRRIESYHYWRDRLVELKQKCDAGTIAGKPRVTGMGFVAAAALNIGNSP